MAGDDRLLQAPERRSLADLVRSAPGLVPSHGLYAIFPPADDVERITTRCEMKVSGEGSRGSLRPLKNGSACIV